MIGGGVEEITAGSATEALDQFMERPGVTCSGTCNIRVKKTKEVLLVRWDNGQRKAFYDAPNKD